MDKLSPTIQPKVLITGINSGIGGALASELAKKGYLIDGTYRKNNSTVQIADNFRADLYQVDFSEQRAIEDWVKHISFEDYEAIIFVHGTMLPIGKLHQVSFSEWQKCNQINFISITQVLHHALKKLKNGCKVITLAGGGINGAPSSYNAYTCSKMSLVKMTELLARDYPQFIFLNVGPGWVDTPIHKQTLNAVDIVPEASAETIRRYNEQEFVPMETVTKTLIHLIESADNNYSGRNFSVAANEVFLKNLPRLLKEDPNLLKLRRYAGVLNEGH